MRVAEPESRSNRFIRSAIAILGETGRTDFTVGEVVARSKASLRAFYQQFDTKDDLLLALVDEIMTASTQTWRDETAELTAPAALRLLIERVGAQPASSTQDSLNRALSLYNDQLAETSPDKHAMVAAPLHRLVADILVRGITDGAFRSDIDVPATAAIVMHTILGALRLRTLGAELTGRTIGGDDISEFCLRGLAAPTAPTAPAG